MKHNSSRNIHFSVLSAVVSVAVDGYGAAFGLVYSSSVKSVVLSGKINGTAVEVDRLGALDTVVCRIDLNSTAVYIDRGNSLNRFVFGVDIDGTAVDGEVTYGVVFNVGGLDAVAESGELESTVIDYEEVLALDCMVHGIDFDIAAVDGETVLGEDTAGVVRIDHKSAGAVDHEVFLGEYSCIGFVICRIVELVLASVSEGVYRTVVKVKNSFLSLPDHDAGTVIVGNARAVENESKLAGVNTVNIDLTVVESTGDIVCTCSGNGDLSVFAYIYSGRIADSGVTGKSDFGCLLERYGFSSGFGRCAGSKHCRRSYSSEKESKNFLHVFCFTFGEVTFLYLQMEGKIRFGFGAAGIKCTNL